MRNTVGSPDTMPAIGGAAQIEIVKLGQRNDRFRVAVPAFDR